MQQTAVVPYVLACGTQDISGCVYYSCTMLSHVGVKTSVNVVTAVPLCFSMHVELKTSVNVVTTVALCFGMHVGVETSVNVVTAVALLFCIYNSRPQPMWLCNSCTICFSINVCIRTSVNVITTVVLCPVWLHYAFTCRMQNISECDYYNCTVWFSM